MITPFQVYCVMIADKLCHTLDVLAFVSGILALIGLLFSVASYVENSGIPKGVRKPSVAAILLFSITITASTLCPDTKTLAAIYVVPSIANSDVVQKDIPEVYGLAVDKLKESLQPKTPEKP